MSPPELPPGLPRNDAGPVFSEPWQAQAFAFVVQLHARGACTWAQWTQTLATELAAHGPDDDGSHYYECWVRALERLVRELGIASEAALAARKEAWAEAYRRTPHGMPVIAPTRMP